MGCRKVCPDREIIPIRQNVNRNEVDRIGKFARAQPHVPDIGVGDGHGNPALYRTNDTREIQRRHFMA